MDPTVEPKNLVSDGWFRAETVDVLDAFGRPTYEDVEGETDPAFEFRYLTAEGEITDRHSGVHMAAMVECLLT